MANHSRVNMEIKFMDDDKMEIDNIFRIDFGDGLISFHRADGVEFSCPITAVKYMTKRPVEVAEQEGEE